MTARNITSPLSRLALLFALLWLPATSATHPGFMLNQAEINQLKTMITQPGYVQQCWLTVKAVADGSVASGSLYTDFRNRPYDNPRHGNPISALGMAYALTGNMSYATKAANVLRAMRDQGGMAFEPGPVNGMGFDGHSNSWIFTLPFTYDLIYNSGALSASDKTSIETWFRGLATMGLAKTIWQNNVGEMPGWEQWATYHRQWRNYTPPEGMNALFFAAAIGFLLEDPTLMKWAIDGNNYPLAGYDRHAATPTTSQNPFSIKHFFHDAVNVMGGTLRLMKREGSFDYGFQQIMGLQVCLEAAWHRGVDLWRYRDPESDGNMQTMMDYATLFVQSHRYYFVEGTEDARWLWELPYSHYRDDLSKHILTYAGPLVGGRSEQRGDYNPRWNNQNGIDLWGRTMPLIAAIDRSTPNVTGVNLGPILIPAGEYSSTATVSFEVVATPSQIPTGGTVSVKIRAIRRADGATATTFVSDSVRLWTVNGSPTYVDYTGGKPYSSTCANGGYSCFVYPPVATPWTPAMNADIPNPIRFTAADAGVRTVTVRLKQGGAGVSYRLEAVEKHPVQYPYKDISNSAAVRGWSNRIFVGTANVGISRKDIAASGSFAPNPLRVSSSGSTASRKIHFQFLDQSNGSDVTNLSIYNAQGKVVQRLSLSLSGGKEIIWKVPQDLSAGVHVCRILRNGRSYTQKVLIAE